jgi:hypothetical protein
MARALSRGVPFVLSSAVTLSVRVEVDAFFDVVDFELLHAFTTRIHPRRATLPNRERSRGTVDGDVVIKAEKDRGS